MELLRKILKWIGTHRALAVIAVLLLVGVLGIANFISKRSSGKLSDPLVKGKIIESVYGIGTVTANKIWHLTPGVVKTISNIWVKEGDDVVKGQKLVGVDRLFGLPLFPERSPPSLTGIGENVFSQVPILTLVDLRDRYIVVSMEQQAELQVRKGQKVTISLDTVRQQRYEGKVVAVYSNDTNYLARIDVGDLPDNILPGMTADIAIELRKKSDVLLVPIAAIERGNTVWRKRGREIPTKIEIKTGIIDKELAEVTAGDLEAGDLVLLRKDLTQ